MSSISKSSFVLTVLYLLQFGCTNTVQLHSSENTLSETEKETEIRVSEAAKKTEKIIPIHEISLNNNTSIKEFNLDNSEILKIQVTNNEPVATSRLPKNETEKSLSYWRHRFKDETVTYSPIASATPSSTLQSNHVVDLFVLHNKEKKINIIYSENREKVVEIINYEK